MKSICNLFSCAAVLLAVLLFGSAAASADTAAAKTTSTLLPDDGGSVAEISALSNGAFFFNGSGSVGFGAVGASVQIIPGLQLALNVVYYTLHVSDSSTWALGALIGPVINFPFDSDLRNAFFASAKYGGGVLGGTYVTSGTDNSKGVLDFSVGKRFKISEHISYAPEVGFSDVLGGGSTDSSSSSSASTSATAFRIVLFGFSAFF